LKPADFHILLALAAGPLHGYRIMKEVERDTGGDVTLEIGSLYRLLARLVTEGLIDDTQSKDERAKAPGDRHMMRRLAVDVGDQDGLRVGAGKLHDVLDSYGIAHAFEI
jgi:hypothetical protein